MIRYLLGSLSEEERERLDELSFIDDEFAVRLSSVENDLVDAYARGELSGERLERFDTYYLASPMRREKVKTARAFHALAGKAVATGQVVLAPGPSHADAESDRPSPRSALPPWDFTFPRLVLTAAAMLGLVGVGWMIVELSRLRSQLSDAQAARLVQEQREKELQAMLERQRTAGSAMEKDLERAREEKERIERQMALERARAGSKSSSSANLDIVAIKLAAAARGAGQGATITVPSGTDYVILQVELEPDDYPGYNAVLLTQQGKKPAGWKRERLKSKALGEARVIDIVIPAGLLKPQEYIMEVTGISNTGVAEGERGYPFRVVRR
jgi:hypothetical protein